MAIAAAFPFLATAQSNELPVIVVTASPVIESNTTDSFAALKTTVSAQQIEDLNAIDAASALRRTPGVTISRFNPVGAYGGEEGGAVYIRGMGTSRPGSEIKTYVDGIPFYMSVWNHPLLDLLPINGMSRLDVYKGPQPQLFANTFGAINLVPKTAKPGDGVTGDVSFRFGSFGSGAEQFDLAGRSGDWDYSVAQGLASSDGHRPDADGRLANLMGRVGYRINPQWTASLLLLATDNVASDPGHITTGANRGDTYATKGQLATLTLAHDYNWLKGETKFYDNRGQAVQQPGLTSRFHMSGLRWHEEVKAWQGGLVSAGVDVDRMSGDVSPVGFDSPRFTITSPFVGISQTVQLGNGWTLTPSAGVRHHIHNLLGDASTPHVGLMLADADQFALRANVSKGVSYPGMDAAVLSHLISALGSSWRNLGAEKMDHQELGAAWFIGADTTLDLSVFRDEVQNRYVFAFPPAVPSPSFINLGQYSVKGAELSAQVKLGQGWSLFGGLTGLDSSKADLPYAPSRTVSFGANWQAGLWRASLDAQSQSGMTVLGQSRANGSANTTEVGGFTVANIRLGYRVPKLGQRGEVFAAIENLLDKAYQFRDGYPMPGRSLQVGVKASF